MNTRSAYLRGIQLVAVCALPWGLMPQAHATGCPHTADIFLDSKTHPTSPNDPTVGSTRLLELMPGQTVNITGKMKFRINVLRAAPGDSCLLSFGAPGTTRSIGGGLTLTWGAMYWVNPYGGYSNAWPTGNSAPCGVGVTWLDYGRGSYKWGGAYDYTAAWGWETWNCGMDTPFVPFTITGNYTGGMLSLKPVTQRTGSARSPYIVWNGWYSIATGESSRGFNPWDSFVGNSSGTPPLVINELVIKEPPCRIVNKRSIKKQKLY